MESEAGRGRTSPTVVRRRLGSTLKGERQSVGYTQGEVAKALGWPTSKVSVIESAQRAIQGADLEALLTFYEVPDDQKAAYIAAGHAARRNEWWDDDLRNSIHRQLRPYTGYEQGASILQTYQPHVVPGLLQTSGYTAAFLEQHALQRVGPRLIKHLMQHRAQRQEVLDHPTDPLTLHLVLDECALHRTVGSADVMREQLTHLATVASTKPNVTVQIVPPDRPGTFTACCGPFTIMDLPIERDPGLIFCEQPLTGGVFHEDIDTVARYSALFAHVCELALSPDESLQRIATLKEEVFPP